MEIAAQIFPVQTKMNDFGKVVHENPVRGTLNGIFFVVLVFSRDMETSGVNEGEITFKRLWSNMPLWCKTLWSALYIPVLVYPRTSHDFMCEEFFLISMSLLSNGKDVLVHERDKFMSSTLLEVARKSRSVVAVVGGEHLQGIKRNWKQPVVLEDLLTLTVPKPKISATRILTFVGVAIAGVSIISELYL